VTRRPHIAFLLALAAAVATFAVVAGVRTHHLHAPKKPIAPLLPSSTAPTVYLLGGSSARECIVSNEAWSRQLSALARSPVRAYDLGVTEETYTQDAGLVRSMPDGPALVLIGVSVGRYTHGPSSSPPPLEVLAAGSEIDHSGHTAPHPLYEKRAAAEIWLTAKYPLFEHSYPFNSRELQRLIDACRKRGFQVATVELPIDLQAVGTAFDPARRRYAADLRNLTRRGVPSIRLLEQLDLPSRDFWDLFHLLTPGARVWQRRLSEEVVPLLRRGGPSALQRGPAGAVSGPVVGALAAGQDRRSRM
jgi:hypothetical protein